METWDYIVVGAGSAGCVVARRLSDDPDVRVLLLEAGPPAQGFWIRTPAGMARLFLSERYNWRHTTEAVPGLRNRRIYWPRGKALGGSGAINGMVWTRGNRRDYDHWASLGNPGWSWQEVLPFFKRAEDNQRGANAVRGTGGPCTIADPRVDHPAVRAFIAAAQQSGVPAAPDLSCAGEEGVGVLQASIRDGQRQSAYDAYLAPVRARPNLTIRTDVQVCRVVLEQRGGIETASGVEFIAAGTRHIAHAAREVILSAGSLSSPHLLMLSGIGDAAMLARHGIQTRVHRPGVGRNLQDHCSVSVKAGTAAHLSYNRDLRGWRRYRGGLRYLLTHQGYLALGSSLAAAFVRSSAAMDYADLEISFRPMTFTFDDAGHASVDADHAISASVYRVRPAARGHIALRSADPLQAPAFHPNYLDNDADRAAMVAGLRKVRAILAAAPLAATITAELAPGPHMTTDDALLDYIERTAKCAYHPAGSCKMGPDHDALAVVDARLRVHGVARLRVIDASIMPTVTSGNTNAPTIMIGEMGAALIRADAAGAQAVQTLINRAPAPAGVAAQPA